MPCCVLSYFSTKAKDGTASSSSEQKAVCRRETVLRPEPKAFQHNDGGPVGSSKTQSGKRHEVSFLSAENCLLFTYNLAVHSPLLVQQIGWEWALVHKSRLGQTWAWWVTLPDALREGHAELGHAVHHGAGDMCFGLLRC